MQPSQSPRASLLARLPRFNSATGRPRRGWAALAGGIALALVLGSGIAVAATGAAEAHTPSVSTSCAGVTVVAASYNTNNGQQTPNSVEATIDGVVQAAIPFGNSLTRTFSFVDPSKTNTYTITVKAWDDPKGDNKWTQTFTGKVDPCAKPTITANASACDVKTGQTSLTANFGSLVANRPYLITVNGAPQPNLVPTQTTATLTFAQTAGQTYTITITDSTIPGLKASTDVVSVGCPTNPNIRVSVEQCTTENASGKFTITADVVKLRVYEVKVYSNNSQIDSFTETASSNVLTRSYTATPSNTYYFTLRDVAADPNGANLASSVPQKFLPCPATLPLPDLALVQCTATNGVANSTLGISLIALVIDRSYTVTVSGGPTAIPAVNIAPATTSNWSNGVVGVLPGSYVVTVTDVTDPRATGFTASATAVLAPCPSQQEVTLVPSTCTVPGGTSDISATVTKFTIGRAYSIAITQANAPVAGYPAQSFTPANAQPVVFNYTGLTPGVPYRVIVTDTALTSVIGAADVTPAACPGNPEVVVQAKCAVLSSASVVSVAVDKLFAGETYTVSLTKTSNGAPVSGVAAKTVTGSPANQTVQFDNVPNGTNYTVTVANAAKTLTGSKSFELASCSLDLTTLSLPTLALTGSSTLTPTLAGIGFLQFGLVLVGISLYRRRSGTQEA